MAPPRAAHTCQTETLTTHKPPAIFTACRWLLFSATVSYCLGRLSFNGHYVDSCSDTRLGPLLFLACRWCLFSATTAFPYNSIIYISTPAFKSRVRVL